MKKKLLFVCIGSNIGGIERSMIDTLNSIDINEFDVDLLLWNEPGELYPFIRKDINFIDAAQVGILQVEKLNQYPLKDKVNLILRFIKYKIYLSKNEPWKAFENLDKSYDYAVAYSQNDYSAYYIIDKVKAKKKILWFHNGKYSFDSIGKQRNNKYYPQFDYIVAVSDDCKNELLRYFPKLKNNIVVKYNIIDSANVRNMADLDDIDLGTENSIVTVARLSDEKGIDIALETAKLLNKNNILFKWYFIGDGKDKDKYKNLVKDYGIEDSCIFLGAKANPYPYMKKADLYVQP